MKPDNNDDDGDDDDHDALGRRENRHDAVRDIMNKKHLERIENEVSFYLQIKTHS